MSHTQTPGGEGSSQPFRHLEFDRITPRAVVRTVRRAQSDNESIDEPMSDSDAPVTKMWYAYQPAHLTGSPDDLDIPTQFLREFVPWPPSVTSCRGRNPRTERRPPPPPYASREVPQEAVAELLNEIVKQGRKECDKQRTELNELAAAIMSQATEVKKQQDAQNVIYVAARTLYEELKVLRQQVKAELESLQAETTSQSQQVTTVTERIADTLTKQWEGMTDLLKTETTSIVEAACKEFKEVNDQLVHLHKWTKKKIEQETQDRINSDTTIKKAGEAALKTIASLKRKLRDPEDPLGTASTKRQRPAPGTTRQSRQQSEIPQPPPTKKESRNVPQPDKYDGSSAKLKAFLNHVATVFECMPVTYETANDKILYVRALLTDSAKTW